MNTIRKELENILRYWMDYTVDQEHGGFYGKISNDNRVDLAAPKGAVLSARILWSFSAAYNCTHTAAYLEMAERSFQFIRDYFIDKKYGSVYWSVTFNGEPLDTKKQIYALAFTIYGLSEFYRASGNQDALDISLKIYNDIEKYSRDALKGGYLEAFSADWKELPDLRLSEKDANEKKTMNTHLHILEAYTNLYRVWPDRELKKRVKELIEIFLKHFIDPHTYHLILFLDEDWNRKSEIISFGHEMEASWLILEAATVIKDEILTERLKEVSVLMVRACSAGLDEDGSIYYEFDPLINQMVQDKHWWVQAEAMVGFLNAWQLTGEKQFFQKFTNNWKFTERYILDHQNGEWFWGVKNDHSIMEGEDKAGFWKCPYHNSRACMEIIKRMV